MGPETGGPAVLATERRPRILFVVEGFTDIRFVTALSQVCALSMVVPRAQYRESRLNERVAESGAALSVIELEGGRLAYQWACTRYLWKAASRFDGILTQELLRGSLSASVIGALRRVPTAAYMCLPPLEYFRCRRVRGQIAWAPFLAGELTIQTLMTINGWLCSRCVALGPHLQAVAARYCKQVENGLYYGVDTDLYRPCESSQKQEIRRRLGLPENAFIIFFSSRMSHEKDPETVLRAAAEARREGLNAVVLNLSGSYQQFFDLAQAMSLPQPEQWVIAGPAAHPMGELPDFYCASDCVAQASLAEGLGISPLESFACGVPAICSAVGGLSANLQGYARMVPVRDHEAMKREFLSIASHPEQARAEALAGREFVMERWSRKLAVEALETLVEELAFGTARQPQPQNVKK
jgi:glycosyltransferase involved in cell wall biosynthesis